MAHHRVLAAALLAFCMLSPRPSAAAASLYLGIHGYEDCPDLALFDGPSDRVVASYCFQTRGIAAVHGLALDPGGKLFLSAATQDGQGSIITLGGGFEVPHATSGGLMFPGDLAFGPDGNLYVIGMRSGGPWGILRYDGRTGSFLGSFIERGTSGLDRPLDLLFLGDSLLVSDVQGGILRYDAYTGAFVDTFVALGSGGLQRASFMKQGLDGDLFVSDGFRGVLRYDGESGVFVETFLPAVGEGYKYLGDIAFGSDGDIYVDELTDTGGVVHYDSTTRTLVGYVGGSGSTALVIAAPAIPEPSAWVLLLSGLAAVVGIARRRRL